MELISESLFRRMCADCVWIPGKLPGDWSLKNLVFENGKEADFSSNGFPIGNGRYYFGGGDPQFVIESLPKNTGKLYIEIEVMKESEAQEAFWMSFSRISAEKGQRDSETKTIRFLK